MYCDCEKALGINNPVITRADSPQIQLCFKLFTAIWAWAFGQTNNSLAYFEEVRFWDFFQFL